MASAVNDIGQLLRGGEPSHDADQAAAAAAAAAAAGQHGASIDGVTPAAGAAGKAGTGVDISKLSQLSDFADKELQRDKPTHFSQGSLIEPPHNPLAFQQASQPDIPAPLLPDSQNMSSLAPGGTPGSAVASAEEQQKQMATAAAAMALPMEQMMALMPGMLGMDWSHMAVAPHAMEQEVAAQPGPRSKSGKPTRRGPMDEMRQLVRILAKLLPQSIAYLGANEEAGGGNRISEEQIKNYLEKTLGEAPRPTWGVPNGWYNYVAELFSWALGRPVDEEACKKCAKREPGRSWEALDHELQALGVHPHAWPLPLTLLAVREAEKNPIPQPIPQIPTLKRGSDGEVVPRRSRTVGGGSGSSLDYERMSEYEVWKHITDALAAATNKLNTSPPELHTAVAGFKSQAKTQMDMLTGGLNMLQYVPVMGLDGNPSMMAFLGGMQGMTMGLPPVTGQLVGPDGQLMAADGVAAAAAAGQPGVPPGELGAIPQLAGTPGSTGDERLAKRVRQDGEPGDGSGDDGGQDKSRVPLSSNEARGTLMGALAGGDPSKAGQLPLLYASTQPGAAAAPLPFSLPPAFPPGMLPPAPSFPGVEGSVAMGGAAPAGGSEQA